MEQLQLKKNIQKWENWIIKILKEVVKCLKREFIQLAEK